MSVCIFLFCTLQTVVEAVNFGLHAATPPPGHPPLRQPGLQPAHQLTKQRVAAIPGVQEHRNQRPGSAASTAIPRISSPTLPSSPKPFSRSTPRSCCRRSRKRRGCTIDAAAIIGRKLAQRFGWKVGDTFELESTIPPYRVGHPFEFVVDGIYDTDEAKYPGTDLNSMYFNYKYLYEATGQQIGIGWLTVKIDDPKHAGAISKAIDAEFENSDTPTKTETEQAFQAGFVAMAGNLALLLNGIGLAVAFTILLVTANTMSIAVRERQQEIGVLKTLGFSSGLVMTLILSEALLIGALGGAVGLLISTAP